MHITKKRIRTLDSNLPSSLKAKDFIPCFTLNIKTDKEKIINLGFSLNLKAGDTLLPPQVGPITKFNIHGRLLPDKTKPKVTQYREVEWEYEQWHGKEKITASLIVQIPQEVWQKDIVLPPSVQIMILKVENDLVYFVTEKARYSNTTENITDALHKINLILEISKSCLVLNSENESVVKNIQSLNWKILPTGEYPWKKIAAHLNEVINKVATKARQAVIDERFKQIENLEPDTTYIGSNGFYGYIIFGFSKQKIYILESAFYGNAIYVLSTNWKDLSHKTKKELITEGLHLERITHHGKVSDYISKIKSYL